MYYKIKKDATLTGSVPNMPALRGLTKSKVAKIAIFGDISK